MITFNVVNRKTNKKLESISCRAIATAQGRIEKKYADNLEDIKIVIKLWGGEECRQWVRSGTKWVDSFISAKREKKGV